MLSDSTDQAYPPMNGDTSTDTHYPEPPNLSTNRFFPPETPTTDDYRDPPFELGLSDDQQVIDPTVRQLDVREFTLKGELHPSLYGSRHGQLSYKDADLLTGAHHLIGKLEKQVIDVMYETNSRRLPESVPMEMDEDLLDTLMTRPMLVATLLTDTLILAAGQIESFSKDVRLQAILGIAQTILEESEWMDSLEVATAHVIRDHLSIIERRRAPSSNAWHRVAKHARKLLLQALAERWT